MQSSSNGSGKSSDDRVLEVIFNPNLPAEELEVRFQSLSNILIYFIGVASYVVNVKAHTYYSLCRKLRHYMEPLHQNSLSEKVSTAFVKKGCG